jgi:flagellar biosynthetic protein FlhB
LAAADFFVQRWRFEESIKQTKAEVKEDMKALEGNPAVRGKVRSIQRDTARRRMMSRVKDADVHRDGTQRTTP